MGSTSISGHMKNADFSPMDLGIPYQKKHTQSYMYSGWWYTYPSENMKVSWGDYSQYMEK